MIIIRTVQDLRDLIEDLPGDKRVNLLKRDGFRAELEAAPELETGTSAVPLTFTEGGWD